MSLLSFIGAITGTTINGKKAQRYFHGWSPATQVGLLELLVNPEQSKYLPRLEKRVANEGNKVGVLMVGANILYVI